MTPPCAATQNTKMLQDHLPTRVLLKWGKDHCEANPKSRILTMSSVEARTTLLGTAFFIMNYGAYLITQSQVATGIGLFLAGTVVIYTRELLFDIEYNGHGNIVDAMFDQHNDNNDN